MITSARFRTLRLRVAKEVILSSGFVLEGTKYVRRVGPQWHLLGFEAWKYGGEFAVDLGVHFSLLPLFKVHGRRGLIEELGPESCCFQARLNRLSPGYQQFLKYGETDEEAIKMLEGIYRNCLSILDEWREKWQDGKALLEMLPPDILSRDSQIFDKLRNAPTREEQNHLSGTMRTRQLFPGWFPKLTRMALLLGWLAVQGNQKPLVPGYLEIARKWKDATEEDVVGQIAKLMNGSS